MGFPKLNSQVNYLISNIKRKAFKFHADAKPLLIVIFVI